MKEEYQPRLNLFEVIALVAIAGLIDLIGIIIVLFALDDFFLLDIFGTAIQIYFRFRKVNGAGYDLAATIGEYIPYVGALPLKTAGVLAVVWIDRHPTGAAAAVVTVARKVVPAKGRAPAKGGFQVKTPVSAASNVTQFKPKIDSIIKEAA